jgi:uncharacterized protein YbgA (DUF1722 family)
MITKTIIEQCRTLYPQAGSDKAAVDLAAQNVFRFLKHTQEEYNTLCQIRRELDEAEINESEFKVVTNA